MELIHEEYNGLRMPEINLGDSTHILHLPYTVQAAILDELRLADVLNLRLTCKGIFEWIQNYSNLRKRLSNNAIFLTSPDRVQIFANSLHTLPFTYFYITFDIFIDPSSIKALKTFAPAIQKLRMHRMHFCASDEEFELYNSMTCLKSLVVYHMEHKTNEDIGNDCTTRKIFAPRVPPSFTKSLESFTCHQSQCSSSFYTYDILAACPLLSYISTPILHPEDTLNSTEHFTPKELYYGDIIQLGESIAKWYSSSPQTGRTLNLRMNWCERLLLNGSLLDLQHGKHFLEILGNFGVKLLNAHVILIKMIDKHSSGWDKLTQKNILSSIVNLRGICPVVQLYELPNLEELEFTMKEIASHCTVHNCCVKYWDSCLNKFPVWTKLRKIVIKLFLYGTDDREVEDTSAMLDFLLRSSHKRINLEELYFKFRYHPLPTTPEHFTVNFPNLQKLYLENPFFIKDHYCRLFLLLGNHTRIRNLNLLSDVLLDDETFNGPIEAEGLPYFSRLKYLKKFALNQQSYEDRSALAWMTDWLLISVFASLPLERLVINGWTLCQLTEAGIEALAAGQLGKSICDFYLRLRVPRDPGCELTQAYGSLRDLMQLNRASRPQWKVYMSDMYK